MRVAQLQNILNFWKWGDAGRADGQFGSRTEAAVKIMQSKIGAGTDGVYGPQTRTKLVQFLTAMSKLG